MTRPLSLPDFGFAAPLPEVAQPAPGTDAAPSLSDEDALEAFDRGYKSGWDDCAAAEAEERRSVGGVLAHQISEAKLTQDAARRDLLAALGPFFDEMVATFLPRMAAEAVAPAVIAELTALADGQLTGQVELHAAPSDCAALQRLIEGEGLASDLTIRPEPAFAAGQVSIRLGLERRDVDMSDAADRIAQAISGFRAHLSDDTTLTQGAA